MMTKRTLYHRPGLIAKNKNRNQKGLNNEPLDPLRGNYTILEELGIITAYEGFEDKLSVKSFTIGESSLVEEAALQLGEKGKSKQTSIVSGDFNSDGKSEIAVLYTQNENLYLQLISYSEVGSTRFELQNAVVDFGKANPPSIKAITGINDQGITTLIVSWCDTDYKLNLWIGTFDRDLNVSKSFHRTLDKVVDGKTYTLHSGVFSGHTNNEIVICYYGEPDLQNDNLFLDLYDYEGDQINKKSSTTLGQLFGSELFVEMIAGTFLVDSIRDNVVVSWTNEGKIQLATYIVDENNLKFEKRYGSELAYATSRLPIVRFAAGDLNMDGVEELLIGVSASSAQLHSYLHLRLYSFNNVLEPEQKSEAYVYGGDDFSYITYDYRLAIGSLENNTGMGILISALGTKHDITPLLGYAMFSLGLLKVDPALRFPERYRYKEKPAKIEVLTQNNDAYSSDKPPRLNLALNLGNFNGKSIRVEKPIYKFVSQCVNVMAVINMVPTQKAFGNSGGVSFTKTSGQTTSLAMTTNRSFTTSNSLNASLGIAGILNVNKSISNTYGENFTKAYENFKDVTEGLTVNTYDEDYIIMVTNDFHTWEYPVYDAVGGEAKGRILLVFPTDSDKKIKVVPGLAYDSNYRPRHLLGNLLSYSDSPPIDYDPLSGSFCNSIITTGNGTVTIDASWSNKSSESLANEISQDQSIGTSVGAKGTLDFLAGSSFGVDYSFEETYTESKASTYEIEFMQSTEISIDLNPFDQRDKTYEVTPYVYWSIDSNYLKLDYRVNIPASSTYYKDNFSEPEASFHLPWAGTGHNELYSRDLNFIINEDDWLTVEVTVHNDTLGQLSSTNLLLFNGDPKNNDQLGTATIASIAPRQFATAVFKKILQVKDQTEYQIYAQIESSEKVAYGIYEKSGMKILNRSISES